MNELTVVASEFFENNQCDFYINTESEIFMTIKQLAKALGYKDRNGIEQIISRNNYLKETEFSVTDKLSATDGKRYNTRLFTEDGIYEVTMLSNTKIAFKFRKWVRNIIKSIRKTGKYEANQNKPVKQNLIEDKSYKYINKYYNGQPVLTLMDLEYFTGLSKCTFNYCLKKWNDRFTEGVDYWHLKGLELRKFKNENPGANSLAKELIIISKSGFDRLNEIIGFDVESPKIFIEDNEEKLTFYKVKSEYAVDDVINPNIKTDKSARSVIDSAREHIDTLGVLLRSFDKYNNLSAYKAYQAAMMEVVRALYQRITVICNLDVQDEETRIIAFRDNDKEWQSQRKELFKIKGEEKFGENETLVIHGECDDKHVFYLP